MTVKRLIAICCAIASSFVYGHSDAGIPPGTGLVIITRPTGGQIAIRPGATQVEVHLEVAFGKDLAGAPADPATFSARVTGMSTLLLMPLFTDVKDANGTIVGKKADVTLPLKKKYTFGVKVYSVSVAGANPIKGSVKTAFVPVVVPPSPPVIQNFRISNVASSGTPMITVGQGATFQADLSDPDGDAVVSYSLDLGDGSAPITMQSAAGLASVNETAVYSTSGDFTATLTVTDSDAQSASQTLTLHVNAPPAAKLKINPSQGTFRYPVTFDALDSTDPDGDALTYSFDFGDGSAPVSGSNAVVTHTYVNPGVTRTTYSVTLTVTDTYGAASTAKSSLKVTSDLNGNTLLHFVSPLKDEVATVGATLSVDVALGKASSGADPDPATFKATFDRVNVTSYFTPVTDPKRNNAVVGEHGNIPASMVRMDGSTNHLTCAIKSVLFTSVGGTIRTISTSREERFTATTGQPPTASFSVTPSEAKVNQTVTFDASGSRDPQGKALTYAWDFGDGVKSAATSSTTVTHAYATEGAYSVTLTVSNGVFSVTATSSLAVRALSTGGNPVLTVSIPNAASNVLDFGDLDGFKNITVTPNLFSSQTETYPAWVEKCVEITNSGTGTLTVSSLAIDNPAFQVRNATNVQTKALGAGESYFIDVRFNPRPYTPPNAPAAASPGSQAGTLTIVTNAASGGTQAVSLTGNVVSGVSGSNIRLMRSDILRTPDDSSGADHPVSHQPGNAAVLDMGIVANQQSFLFGGVVNEGTPAGIIRGVDVVDDQGQPSPDFSAQLMYWDFSVTPESFITMAGGASLENIRKIGFSFAGDFIQVTFHPTNTAVTQQRLSARMLIHTGSGVDQVVGLTGIGIDTPFYTIGGGDFEFSRTSPGNKTTSLYENSNVSPATLTVVNIGRQPGTLTAAIAGIDGGSAPGFSVSPASLTLNPTQKGTFTLTFAPTAAQHYAGVLKVDPGNPYQSSMTYLLHGYGKGGVGMLGTPGNCYTYDASDFNQTEMISLGKAGTQSAFSQLDGLQDPFKVGGNTVDMGQYSNPDWSSLVLLAGKEYTIDGAVFGPYTLTTDLTLSAQNRLSSNQPIYSGGIESHANFISVNGKFDIQSDPTTNDPIGHNGVDPIRLDVTPDGILFYTSVSSNLLTAPTPVITTSLKWKSLSSSSEGVVSADVATLLGVPNDEVLDMRVIKLASGGYRAFFIFDASDALGHQVVGDMDLSSSFTVAAHKSLTGTLSNNQPDTAPGANQLIAIDGNGFWYTSTTVQNPDGTSTMQVYRENLHASAGAVLFGSVTVDFGDADAGEVLLDNLGNVILMTNEGLCAFSSTGAFTNYIMESQTYYADGFVGGSSNGSDTQDLSDFNLIWLDK